MADSKQIMGLLLQYMRIAGEYTQKSGTEKKQFVLDSITQKIDSPEVAELLSHVIDYLIDVEKGRLRINPQVKKFLCC